MFGESIGIELIAAVLADGGGKIMAGVVLKILVENKVEEVVVEVVLVGVVEVRFMVFSKKQSLLGKQFEHRHSSYISQFFCIFNTVF